MKRPPTRSLLLAAAVTLGLPIVAPAQTPAPSDPPAVRTDYRADRVRAGVEARVRRLQERIEEGAARIGRRHRTHLLFGKDYRLPAGEAVAESIVVIGGSATIDGHATSRVTVIGGRLTVGARAVIDGDVSVVGGDMVRDPNARIGGDVEVANLDVSDWRWRGRWPVPIGGWDDWWWDGIAAAFTVGRVLLVLIASLLFAVMAPGWLTTIAARLTGSPGVSAVVGFGAEILFAPAMVLLAVVFIITIVGIPLLAGLPILAAAFACMWVAGYAAVAGVLGARLRGTDWAARGLRPLDVVLGAGLLSGVTLAGQALMVSLGPAAPAAVLVHDVGWAIEYIAWTLGLGAALAAWVRPGDVTTGRVGPVIPPLPNPPAPASPNAF